MSVTALNFPGKLTSRRSWWSDLIVFVASAAATAICAAASGETFGLVLGGLFCAALLTPPLTCGRQPSMLRIETALAVSLGITAVWLCLLEKATLAQWVMLEVMLVGLTGVAAALVDVLETLHVHRVLAAAFAVLLGVAWLTWPIWLSSEMTTPPLRNLVPTLVLLHPPLVANGILTFTAPWTEQTIAYQLTSLDQDMPLRLPGSAVACIGVEFGLSLGGFALSQLIKMVYTMTKPSSITAAPDRPAPV